MGKNIKKYHLPADVEFTVTVLEILCCLYPLTDDAPAVTTFVGTGGATLFSITLTVDLEDDEIVLLEDATSTLEDP